MAESTKQDVHQATAELFVRRGEAFWREVFTQWQASGIGVRVSAGAPHDGVTLVLAGVRIELSEAHAERVVDFVLGQLGGGRC